MHGEVDRRLARALEIQNDRILARHVSREGVVVARMDLADAGDASLDDRRLCQDDVIRHGPSPRAGYAR